MTIIKHAFQSEKADTADESVVGSSEWNAEHEIAGSRFVGGDGIYLNGPAVDDVVSHDAISGLHVVKTALGVYAITGVSDPLYNVLIQPAHGFYVAEQLTYYGTVTVTFHSDAGVVEDPSFFLVIGFGDGATHA